MNAKVELIPCMSAEDLRSGLSRLGEQVMYFYAPGGLGRSELAAALGKPAGRLKGIQATGRNWNSVKALAEMARSAA